MKKKTKYKDMSYTSLLNKDIKINDFSKKVEISGMGGVQRKIRVKK